MKTKPFKDLEDGDSFILPDYSGDKAPVYTKTRLSDRSARECWATNLPEGLTLKMDPDTQVVPIAF